MASDDKMYTFGPAIFATRERLRARFNAVSQIQRTIYYSANAKCDKHTYAQYCQQFPEEADRLHRLQKLSSLTGYATALGFFGGAFSLSRITKSPPLLLVGVFLTTASSHLVADDIGSWIYGTYKFDNADTNEKLAKWAYETQQQQQQQ